MRTTNTLLGAVALASLLSAASQVDTVQHRGHYDVGWKPSVPTKPKKVRKFKGSKKARRR